MSNDISQVTHLLFSKPTLAEVTVSELEAFIDKYPYVGAARFLLAKKEYDAYPSAVHDDVITAGLYFNNPLWFEWQLRKDPNEADAVPLESKQESVQASPPLVAAKETETLIEFQSYHTIDYFASQGIRLQQAELTKDKLGQQLKSFTEWLRSMKKLPSAEPEGTQNAEESQRQEFVIRNAASSIEEKEVVTEAMAEVWAKQRNWQKAIDTYNKLSLLNPSKSAYFASKIEHLKRV